MKRIILAAIALITIGTLATSCSKDKEDLIIGKWKITSGTVNGEISSEIAQAVALASPEFEFKKDGTVWYSITNPFATDPALATTTMQAGTYAISGNSLVISPSVGAEDDILLPSNSLIIKKLTSKELQLKLSVPNSNNPDQTDTIVVTLKKK